jgi:hypothetical protein
MKPLLFICLGALLLPACVPSYRSTKPPKTLSEAQHRAAQRQVRRYYNEHKRLQLLGYE